MATRIIELAAVISRNAATIDAVLALQNLPQPSFEPSVGVIFPQESITARDALLDATQELHDLLLAPMSLIYRKSGHNNMVCMKAIVRYNIADKITPGESMSYQDLSKACGLAEQPLKHLLRHGMTMRIFAEPERGVVAHTAASALMRDPNCRVWLEAGTDDLWPASVNLVDALAKWPDSEEPNHTGWNIAHDTEEPLYQKLATDDKLATRFAASMTATIANNPAFDPAHLHRSYDWQSLGNGLVVDVGGSHGTVSISLAREYSSLRFISQDLGNTIETASSVPKDVANRVQLMAHDFFTPQPVKADAYLFRWIFHSWSDKYATRILQALIPALKPKSRVLIQDGCMPPPGVIPNWRERDLRGTDLIMKAYFNAWERDADEWRELFTKADPNFKFVGIYQPEGSALALIEARWIGNSNEA
ncbi:sterigmatocystin 8-O-methyltransferase [Lophiotrema nucula]|uniref:Sterigmatocystin 8-O-methyltransferase n=1 Tax=Lophiotrema nucula TaxID=690887 RepID=A0A6A5ZSN5_9PLEO|nr:sterigmatocystin 8-O-methyltransferase [Lophiotrema nucula]